MLYKSTLLAIVFFFFFNDTATTEIYTLSLHDALPIFKLGKDGKWIKALGTRGAGPNQFNTVHAIATDAKNNVYVAEDRKSTRLNSSHSQISYAVFCLKKKNNLY